MRRSISFLPSRGALKNGISQLALKTARQNKYNIEKNNFMLEEHVGVIKI